MKSILKKGVHRLLVRSGYALVPRASLPSREPPPDLDAESQRIICAVTPFTMTAPDAIFALIQAVRHVVRHDIRGAIVECGVWKGGSMAAVAHTLRGLGDGLNKDLEAERELYLFDTFEGMPAPTARDVSIEGEVALEEFRKTQTSADRSDWCRAAIEEVRGTLRDTGYDAAKIHFVPGKVEDTIPIQAPAQIAILRLDTDFYASTQHELIHLFPRLTVGGVLIIDDYGFWAGQKQAVDEYFTQHNVHMLLHRVNQYGVYIGVKT